MNRIAIVTGAASGIGLALSKALIDRGDTVVLTDTDDSALREAVSTVAVGGTKGIGRRLDVRDRDQFTSVVQEVIGDFGRLDLLFNNAGVDLLGETDELTMSHWKWMIDINLRGVVNGVDAAYPIMVGQRSGHIVNTASLAGLVPRPYQLPYVTTKHAVIGLSLALRAEAAGLGVRVTAVCPGVTNTPLLTKTGPSDLPRTGLTQMMLDTGPKIAARRWAERVLPGPYSAERLAQDALRGIDRNAALVVAPRSARIQWAAARLSPTLNNWLGKAIAKSTTAVLTTRS
jgi:NAD(P)-dependent dehydrogenase (short-subunit alcohol dehydrogenase family)